MNILVINNETRRIDELCILLQNHIVTEITPMHISDNDVAKNDLIILTGSHKVSLIGHEAYFNKEIELIKSCSKPIIGICLGLQLIAYAYEGFVGRMPAKHDGIKNIQVVGSDPIFGEKSSFKVYSSHRWMVERIDFPLIGLARSEDGWEIVKHSNKNIYGFQFHPEVQQKNILDGKWLFERIVQTVCPS
ncbi:hypothetical protein A2334_03020 [Candidatus Roizmanbacteria bacterium RIFOXYB2_FULL_38_10]|uniref:Glutamine amidotransferase domain-containing protein n=1 Tax=Candidatus Roizmanbacteria bacterium RIFOXYD1_FULL_38_12 TaxID=1802093 RepID=A0A1F7L0D0_9BACT|nr:MAG: hypothetical protein A3K47_01985 [Candidatus Roizmanbacteria bacterium RIFOXYA2_FULL_38_14]OGK63548.1 MAG: hypothetical protein A3K27_01985 [Candidatus Roizmanbacteria bacterium RIFOXYA1_FULL_37_12]OGK65394.1 MAG: hypothetical protein A3K38_01985 [Candidatus Roizmanbacteria bacterium RIFOXYB1_FULL_40_23]OGK69130.1 MAG: hypothetical protein A2334_03020 [Candidatus Roizmanbacteria bacterium RIFOXYB2_FULL_38_10]OGK69799.1 MAG: hypothetical protein A3K21_01990 [Candidatus Roizmanbacteria ba